MQKTFFKKHKISFLVVLAILLISALTFGFCKKQTAVKEDLFGDGFQIHFIDVGQADCALVACDGKFMLIDGGNSDDSSTVYTYLKKYGITELEYIIATHAHEDHVGGLSGALNFAKAQNAFCPVTEYDSKAFDDFVKNLDRQGLEITVPSPGDSFELGSAQVDIFACNSTEDTNNTSIVLKITYGQTSFLFTGDAEYECEKYILDHGYDLSSTVLKVGHHGSSTSTSYRFLREVMPEYAIISVGKDNEYGHPHEEVVSRLDDADVTVYRTDISGDIICISDGKSVTFKHSKGNPYATEKSSASRAQKTEVQQERRDMVLNTKSKKYHETGCDSIGSIAESNKKSVQYTQSEVEALGYSPCGSCH